MSVNWILQTDRLKLRELTEDDDVGMFEMDSDPEVHRFILNQPLTDIQQSREIILMIQKQYREHGIGRWAVISKETNEFIGWAGIKIEHNVNQHDQFYDLGYRFIQKHWNKGYATEVVKGLIKYGFEELKLEKICAFPFTRHVVSARVLEKCGFKVINHFLEDGDDNLWFEYQKKNYYDCLENNKALF